MDAKHPTEGQQWWDYGPAGGFSPDTATNSGWPASYSQANYAAGCVRGLVDSGA